MSTSNAFITNMEEPKQVKFNGSRRFIKGSDIKISQ